MTLEEALDQIMQLTQQNNDLTTERDALITERDQLSKDLTASREQAQRFFLQVTQGSAPDEPESEPVKTCEDFARGIYKAF